jgi:protein TonB
VPPVEEAVPVIVEPLAPPPAVEDQKEEPSDEEKPEVPQVVVVVPQSPEIHFAVPTLGNVVAPGAMAQAPPLLPLQPPAPLRNVPASLDSTGAGGERPQPPYPKIALEQGQQGRVTLLMSADEAGNILTVEVKTSSGFPALDHGAMEYVRRHWTLPSGSRARLFEATITYQIQAG